MTALPSTVPDCRSREITNYRTMLQSSLSMVSLMDVNDRGFSSYTTKPASVNILETHLADSHSENESSPGIRR